MRHRFDGWIAGLGTERGVRIVLGHWPRSPFGAVSDVMLERPDGHRLLIAANDQLAAFVAATYVFDETLVSTVDVDRAGPRWTVHAGPLRLSFATGPRGLLGGVLRAVPPALARRPAWIRLVDLPARVVLGGVRTSGTAREGRREWYGAQDLHPIARATASLDGADLGGLAPVDPPVRFGFGSTPRTPALVRITTTVEA